MAMANGNSNDEIKQHGQKHTDDDSGDIATGSAASTKLNARDVSRSGEIAVPSHSVLESSSSSCARGTLNDLVADLCVNDANSSSNRTTAYGDYTNIRATPEKNTSLTMAASCTTSATTTTASTSSFSFKHFLNSSGTITAPSTTVTSLDAVTTTAGVSTGTGTTTTSFAATTAATIPTLQTSTGARPKVPQSASVSLMPSSENAAAGNSSSTSKMKRSPRFSSFDSQASLAEYAAGGPGSGGAGRMDAGAYSLPAAPVEDDDDDIAVMRRTRLFGDMREPYGDFQMMSSSSRYVPRSYSSYDMPPPVSPRRRTGATPCNNREGRPNRLAFSAAVHSPKMKLDLPLDTSACTASSSAALGASAKAGAATGSAQRMLPNNAGAGGDYAPAAAAALPDFVQDHWLDSWYAHDMHLNSPPISPICDFGDEDLPAGIAGEAGDMASGGGGGGGVAACALGGTAGGVNVGVGVGVGSVTAEGTAKMLPDFLSDGPIIHSSQRLADVAVGLPSNSMGSPQDMHSTMQLSTLRLENERLLRELSETRTELNTQIRRANELERQLQQQQQHASSKRAAAVTCSTATTQRYREQVMQLRTELAALRRDNEMLRSANNYTRNVEAEAGAIGGTSTGNCDRPLTATCGFPSATTNKTATMATTPTTSTASNMPRPSNNQQLARELFRAADNAESNLKQLLAGVDNLRQLAAGIQTHSPVNQVSPDLYSDFVEREEDLETYDDGVIKGDNSAADSGGGNGTA